MYCNGTRTHTHSLNIGTNTISGQEYAFSYKWNEKLKGKLQFEMLNRKTEGSDETRNRNIETSELH